MSPELRKRLLSALVLAPPVALAVARGGAWSAGLMAAAAAGCAAELARLVDGRLRLDALPSLAAAGLLPLLPALAPGRAPALGFWILGALSMLAWAAEVARGRPAGAPARVGLRLAGALFAGFGLFALAALRAGPHGAGWTFLVLLATWLDDALAYLGGRALGRHKLAPALSPGKTWEGLASGSAGALAGVLLARALWLPGLPLPHALALAGLCAGLGPLGDLAKSVLKRAAGAKNSGRLIPGHGGLLDRLDAVLFNAPAVLAWTALQGA